MIHQFILAAPKPGMTTQEFQDYWVNVHAVKFAAKIPQIRRYLIDSRVPFDGDRGRPPLPHQGIAEIWLASDEEQLASLQTEEFLHGARLDEPNWAAFWATIVLDTDAHEIVPGPPLTDTAPSWVKVTTLMKRKPGLSLADHRRRTLEDYAPVVSGLPGLRRHLHAHTRDGYYTFGEASFDSVEQIWFDDLAAAAEALAAPYYADQVAPALDAVADPAHVFSLAARENWIIGPQEKR
ncbi:EthD domain-containing protein [Sphaerisporangium perillae]|uniref:EthD domain-containing protein n=1 Tax=Sphaerisporangium perillae TaxID=2935860 RepID=UPI00200DF171|nr:EthD domain-containing protein [Sphaerisporangium perillae]